MSFSSSCHTLTLLNAILGAQCRNESGNFVNSTLDLNRYLSNLNGEFHFKSNPLAIGFVHGAKNITLDGAVLSASLPNSHGSLSTAYLNLNFCVANVNGKLVFKKHDTHIAASCTCFGLRDGSVLTALCLNNSGKLAVSEIDLNAHFGNHDGKFSAGDNEFMHSAKDIRLDGLVIRASLRKANNTWVDAAYDLDTCIENFDGQLRFQKHDGFFDRDGLVVKFAENLPVVGYVVAGYDMFNGDEDVAKRASAECTYTTILTAATVVASVFTGPIGIALGSAIATPLAIVSEDKIAATIHDPSMRNQFPAETVDRFASLTLVNFLATGAAPYLGGWASGRVGTLMSSENIEGVTAQVGKAVANTGGRQVGSQSVHSAFDSLHDSLVRLSERK